MAVFEIEDTGPGIAASEIEHVFEPFARGAEAGAAAVGGTGLGLTIAKMLTDLMGGEMTVASPAPSGVGSLFRIRLFLPGLVGARVDREPPRNARTGYLGPRRRVLVVDNEEVDRDLLANVLAPLGFALQMAASGHDCLALLRQAGGEAAPDAILMDLAMPGIDGWATVRAIRDEALSRAPIAIVSGNAFDKGLDNDVHIAADDFILKPVRPHELLDWLGRRLGLQWVESTTPAPHMPHAEPALDWALPSTAQLRALDELVSLGYFRGIVRKLDEIDAEDAVHAGFVAHLRALAQQFQLDAMTHILRQALAERKAA